MGAVQWQARAWMLPARLGLPSSARHSRHLTTSAQCVRPTASATPRRARATAFPASVERCANSVRDRLGCVGATAMVVPSSNAVENAHRLRFWFCGRMVVSVCGLLRSCHVAAKCPNDCSGQGVCTQLSDIAASYSPAGTYTNWEASTMFGCVCASGRTGPDCSQRTLCVCLCFGG